MNIEVEQLLQKLIHDFGVNIVNEPQGMTSLLKDYAQGQYKREVNLLTLALREGIVQELKTNRLPFDIMAARLVNKLSDEHGIDIKSAQWTVDSWALALGLSVKTETPKSTSKIPTPTKLTIQATQKNPSTANIPITSPIGNPISPPIPPQPIIKPPVSFGKFFIYLIAIIITTALVLEKNNSIKQLPSPIVHITNKSPAIQPESISKIPVTPKTELELTLESAEHGDAEAQFDIGKAYWKDIGSNFYNLKDPPPTTIYWFEKAAAQGLPIAQLQLGHIYQYMLVDTVKAQEWYQKAAQNPGVIGSYANMVLRRLNPDQKPILTNQSATSNKPNKSWLTATLYGNDNPGATLRKVKIINKNGLYYAKIDNQFEFTCQLTFDDKGNPSELKDCTSSQDSWNWGVEEKVVKLRCSRTKNEEICRGEYNLFSFNVNDEHFFEDHAEFIIARRISG